MDPTTRKRFKLAGRLLPKSTVLEHAIGKTELDLVGLAVFIFLRGRERLQRRRHEWFPQVWRLTMTESQEPQAQVFSPLRICSAMTVRRLE
jgi:hypothetical protein